MILLVELLIICALLLQVSLHLAGPRAHKPETFFTVPEGIYGSMIYTKKEILGEKTSHAEGGD
jgi:hypothetical protein